MNDKIVFTEYNVVVKSLNNKTTTIPTAKYLQDLDKKIGNDNNGVFFSTSKNTFYITDDGHDYDVVLPDRDENSLETKNYTALVNNLLYLAAKHRKLSDANNKKIVRETKIKAMENSNYEDIEDVEDLELYLDYLKKEALKNAKSNEEIITIQTKIIGITLLIKRKSKVDDNRIRSSLDFKEYFDKFARESMFRTNKLERRERLATLNKIKGIVKDYKKLNDINQGRKSPMFNRYLAVSLLDRINEVETFLDKKSGIITNPFEIKLTEIMEELKEYADKDKAGVK